MDNFSEKISLWLDDELSPAETADLEAHLETCMNCQQLYTQMRQLDQLFQAAALEIVLPPAGFAGRLEARLAHRQPVKPWQMLVAVGALFSGTLLLLGVLVISGLSLLDSTVAINAGLLYNGLIGLIDSVDNLRVLINLVTLFVKACFITMQQPIFWGLVLLTLSLSSLWMWAMRRLAQRGRFTAELIF